MKYILDADEVNLALAEYLQGKAGAPLGSINVCTTVEIEDEVLTATVEITPLSRQMGAGR